MRYGFFDDARREYVIQTPRTPHPWINYLGCEQFFGLVSNTAGGYSFYRDARLRRLTRYRYNNVPRDMGGRYYYLRDGEDVWNPGWMPMRKELETYECRHGMGYTCITSRRGDLEAEILFFVPLGATAEVHRLTLRNLGQAEKKVSVFSLAEFCLWNALDDQTNFQRNLNTGEVEVEGSTLYHKTEYRERRNHFAFYSVNAPLAGFDTDRDSFLGAQNGFEAPEAVLKGRSRDSIADGWSPIGSHHLQIKLAPGQSQSSIFVLGYAENPQERKWSAPGIVNKEPARAIVERFGTDEQVETAFSDLRSHWDDLLSRYTCRTPDERVDRMVNIWNQYQCMVTFNMSRSASYFESGIGRGMGFRDSNQDLLGFVHQIPERARERILDIAATQFEDGGAYHQYQPLTKKGNHEVGGDFNDDPLWLIQAVCAYVKETGDDAILDEAVPFDHDASKAAPLFEHLKRSFDHVVNNRGPHGLPLIGRADWNDCLNLNCFSENPDEAYQTCTNKDGRTAESVFIAGMFLFIGKEYVELCRYLGKEGEALRALDHMAEMERNVLAHGWDGEWFLRAYDDRGEPLGSSRNNEGRIWIESQGLCTMAGIGLKEGKTQKALDSVREHLDSAHGLVLLQPAFTQYHLHLGEVSSYPPGYKENAGIFCHNNPWIVVGETVLGRGDRAFEYWSKIAPAFREEISDIHRMEPYVYAQMIAGKDAARHGQAKNSWLTGTAAWNFVAISQYILGIRADWKGLIVDPCIPEGWKGFEITRRFRGSRYNIKVHNPKGLCRGVRSISVDGNQIEGNLVPVAPEGSRVQVVAELE